MCIKVSEFMKKAAILPNLGNLKNSADSVKWKNKRLKVKKKLENYWATFTKNKPAVFKFETDACLNKPDEGVRFLEKVELWTSVEYSYRGSLSITIKSPEGTETTLLEPRVQDTSRDSYSGWRFTSVQNWGENPEGTWTLKVKVNLKKSFGKSFTDTLLEGLKLAVIQPPNFSDTGIVYSVQLVLRGTEYPPDYDTDLPRAYTGFRLEDGRTSEDPLPPRKRT